MITSTSNPKIKEIRKLHDRKDRRASGLFYVEGLRHVIEVERLDLMPVLVIVAPELLTSQSGWQIIEKWSGKNIAVLEVSAVVYKSFSVRDDPQGIAVVMEQNWQALAAIQPDDSDLWVALDCVADPGNLGTIMRTNDAAGGKGVILLDQSTDPFDPTAVRASMGSIFSQKLANASFLEFKAWKKENGCPIIGTSDKAKLDYQELAYPDKMVLLMGSERMGLLDHHLALCDAVVRIPMAGRCDSLNLAVATSVILYEVYNQRRKRPSQVR